MCLCVSKKIYALFSLQILLRFEQVLKRLNVDVPLELTTILAVLFFKLLFSILIFDFYNY